MPRLVLDTNLLLVFIVGNMDPNLLGRERRVKEYRPDDYETLLIYVSMFSDVVLLPNVVTETSNLLGQLSGERKRSSMQLLRELVTASSEHYVKSRLAMLRPECSWLGVTDAAILCVLDKDTYLLTSDYLLYMAAISQSMNAEYFNDLRG